MSFLLLQIFNLYPQKGVIAEGSDADLVVFDPQQEHTLSVKTHHSALDYSAYEGMHIKGQVSPACPRIGTLPSAELRHTQGHAHGWQGGDLETQTLIFSSLPEVCCCLVVGPLVGC